MDEKDRFTRLMFGDRRRASESSNKENAFDDEDFRDEGEDEDDSSRNNDWLFGRKREHHSFDFFGNRNQKAGQHDQNSLEKFLYNIDYVELMKHVDTLMTTAKELKPLIKQIKPYLKSFTRKD